MKVDMKEQIETIDSESKELYRYEEPLPKWKRFVNVFRAMRGLPLYQPTLVIVCGPADEHSPLLLPAPKEEG